MVIDNLIEGENSFRRLSENLPGIVYRVLIEDDNRMIFFNDMVQTMTGYNPEDLEKGTVCSIDPLILPEDKLNVINIVKDAIENNVPFEVEYRINTKNGELKWFFERGRPTRGDNGNPCYIDGVIFDITDRKEAEKKLKTSEESLKRLNKELEQRLDERMIGLRDSERKFKSIFIDSPIGIELYDSYGKLREANKACLDMFGVFNRREIEGFDLFSDPNIPKNEMKKLKNGKIIRFEVKFDFDKVKQLNLYETSKSGKFYLDVMITPLYIEDKQEISNYLVQVQDITEHKLNQIKLEEYTEKLEFMVEERTHSLKEAVEKSDLYLNLIEVIIVALDRDGKMTMINKKGHELLGYDEGELIGKNWFETCLPPHDRERVYEYFKKLIIGELEVVKFYENSVWTKNRVERLISWSTVLFKDEKGNITGLLSSGVDITERAITEQKLIESEANYRYLSNELEVILDHIPGIVVYKDTENNILRVNKFMADAHNLEKTEMENRSSFDFYPKDIAQAYWEDDLEVINSKQPKMNIAEPWETDAGKRWVNTSKIPYIDENGNVKGIIAIAFDITERKKTEEELRENEKLLKNAQELAHIGHWKLNPSTMEVTGSVELFKIFGLTRDEATLEKFAEVVHPEDREMYLFHIRRGMEKGESWDIEHRVISKDGTEKWVHALGEAIMDEDGKVLLLMGTVQDITGRMLAEQKLISEKEKAQKYLDIAGVIIVALNADQTVQLINQKGCEILGDDESEIIGMNWFDKFIPQAVREQVKKDFNRILSGEIEPLEKYENAIITKNGKKRIIAWHNHILKNKAGQIIGTLSSGLDITERKQAERELQLERDNFLNILNSMEDGVYIVNQNYDIEFVNPSFIKEFGQFEGMKCFKYFEDRNEICLRCKNKEAFQGKTVRGEWFSFKNQKTYDLIDTPLKNPDGSISKLGIFRDETDKKKAEVKLKESEENFRKQSQFLSNILESLTHPFYVINADDYTVALANFTASSEGLELGKYCYSLTHNNNKPCEAPCECPLKEVKKTKRACVLEHIHYDKEGNEKAYEIYGYPILDESGNVVQMIEYALDITDRKIAQHELKESEKNYRDLFENSPISLWEQDYSEIKYYIDKLKNSGINDLRTYFDKNPEEVKKCVSMAKMININQETIKLFKATKKEDFFAGLDIVFTEESFDTFKEQIINFAGGKNRFESEGVNYALNGDKLSIFIVCEIVAGFKEDWSKILISIVDISEIKKAELIIQNEIRNLRELDQLKNEFIIRTSHELNTPLVSICGSVEFLLNYIEEDFSMKSRAHLESIDSGGKRLRQLADNLLDILRIESHKYEINVETINLGNIIKKCINDHKDLAEEREIMIFSSFQHEFYVKGDEIKIKQVFDNLISNALKNTPHYGQISISSEEAQGYINIKIKDTGVGFTEEEKTRVFEKLGKIEKYGKGLDIITEGSGIGLYLSKEIVELHGGKLWLKSEGRNKGSTFTITLPLDER